MNWDWMIGRRMSLGEVVDVVGNTALVRTKDSEEVYPVDYVLQQDYELQDNTWESINTALNTGNGAYLP